MKISETTYRQMNQLATLCFDANAIFDNLAYNLDYYYYKKIAKIVHLNIAHVMPEWADMITDQMLLLGARPTRGTIGEYQDDISDLTVIFNKILDTMMNLRKVCCGLIETADMQNDDEVRIFGEEFLQLITPYIKQAEEWLHIAGVLGANELNIHITEYTNFISTGN
jgi:hypothetical protein